MGKYLMAAANSIKTNLVYRSNNFITMISIFISFIVLFFFWNSIYLQGNQIGSYTLKEMISYYVFVTIFQLLITGDSIAWGIGDEIKTGEIISNVLKPINYLKFKLAQSIGNLTYRIIIFLPVILLAILVLRNYIVFTNDLKTFVAFLLGALISYALYFLIYFTVGIIAFWTSESSGFFYAAWVVINFMQGGLIPLDLLPKWILVIVNFLPFKYLFFVPISLATGRISFDYSLLLVPLIWGVSIYYLGQILFKRGLKKYEGVGI